MFLATNFDDGSAVIVASAVAVEEKLLNYTDDKFSTNSKFFWSAFSCCTI